MTVFGLIEHDRGTINGASFEMLTMARDVAAQLDCAVEAILIGEEAADLAASLGNYGVSKVYLVQHEQLQDYAPEAWAQCVVQLIETEEPQVVMAAGTDRGNELMAYVAAKTNQPMAANCIEFKAGEPFQLTRSRWGGSLLEEATLSGSPFLVTAAQHVVTAEEVDGGGDVVETAVFTPTLSDKDFRVRITSRIEAEDDKISLAGARIVVGGGRGVGSEEGFAVLEQLAEQLGAAVGGSRVVTNLGWRPHSDQIGQTGTRIAPDLYIACGISGAIQHIVGCKGSKQILAINTDPDAQIMKKADYAVVGDLHEVLPALCEAIKEAKN